jgi:hypothetical protein
LQDIIAHLSKDSRHVRDSTKGAGDAVGKAIRRLLDSLFKPGAKLASLKGIVWVGVGLFVFGLASLVYPPLKVVVASVTTSAALMFGGAALMVLPSLIVGNELLILGAVSIAVGAWFLAYRHGQLRRTVAASTGTSTGNPPPGPKTPTPNHVSRFTFHAPRITHHVSRLPPHEYKPQFRSSIPSRHLSRVLDDHRRRKKMYLQVNWVVDGWESLPTTFWAIVSASA